MWRHTVVEACEAYLQPGEGRHAVLLFQRGHVQVVIARHPYLPQRLEPFWGEDLDIVAGLGDIAVFGAVGTTNNEVGYVRSEVELNGRAHLRANSCEFRLRGH